jgi:hypothetical protein
MRFGFLVVASATIVANVVDAVALGGASKEGSAPGLLRRETDTIEKINQPMQAFDFPKTSVEQVPNTKATSVASLSNVKTEKLGQQQPSTPVLDASRLDDVPIEEPTVTATSLLEVTASVTDELSATPLWASTREGFVWERVLMWSMVFLVISIVVVGVFPSDIMSGSIFKKELKALKLYFATVWVVVLVATAAAMLFAGPNRIIRHLVLHLPAHPGWSWYLGHGAATALSIVLVTPIWPAMCMLSGLVFGLPAGLALNFVVVVGGAVFSIVLGRSFLQAPIRGYFASGDFPWVQRWMRALERDDDSLMFQVLFRFLFIPFFVRNYAPAILKVPLWRPVAATLPHSAWVSFLFASFGASFAGPAQLLKEGKSIDFHSPHWQQIIALWVSFLITSMLGCYLLAKYAQLKIDEDDADANTDDETTRAVLFSKQKSNSAGYLSN